MSNKKLYIKIERTYHYNTNPSRGLHAYVDSTVIIDGEKDYRDPDNLFPMVSIMPVEEYVKRANEYDEILLAYQKDDDVLLVVRYMTSLAELADEFHTVDVYECKFCRKSRDGWILREDYIFCNEECYKEWILKETQESLKRSKKFKRHIKEMEYLEGVETFLEKVKSWGRKL